MSKEFTITPTRNTAFILENISVSYHVAEEKIPSIKEYVIRRLKGEIKLGIIVLRL